MSGIEIETYVFLDLGTTGPIRPLHGSDIWMPDVTELSMIAVKRTALLLCQPNEEPRVQNKFHMLFHPSEEIQDEMLQLKMTNLSDDLLEDEARFDQKAFNAINSFIECLKRPVCLISHSGFLYHFPILKYYLEKMNVHLARDIKCGDSLQIFFDLIVNEKYATILKLFSDANEKETVEKMPKSKSYLKLVRNPFYAPDLKPYESYQIGSIYKRRVNDGGLGKKRRTAEDNCYMMMKIAQTFRGFEYWVQKEHCLFSEVPTCPTFEETWCLDDDEDTDVEDSSSGQKEVKDSSSGQKEEKSSSRWYDIFNYF